ncbi:VapE domain-containing protein [Marinilactibacillus psychrotolerans]|uniref:VapE domain-containing protein n=1 Tax=Marinilactibacillus psychrotolerans TaxID=191770 RepID=UPI00388A866A
MSKKQIEMPDDIKADIEEFEKNKPAENNVMPRLILNSNGNVKKLLTNLKMIIASSPSIKGIGYNEFTKETTIRGEPINDNFINNLRLMVDQQYLITFSKDDVLTVVNQLARELNTYHPIKKMIESKQWDRRERVESLFIDYLGADNNEYIQMVTRKWLVGAVARIYNEGVKFELVPILQGKQGKGKSTIASKLGGKYFVDSLKTLGKTKDDYQLLIGSWIIELGELASLNSTETENTKNFISATSDKLRMPYDRITSDLKRTCVFIGTTNADEYLNDLTGGRRFFPIPLDNEPTKNVFELNTETIQQIWAEAFYYFNQGEEIFSNPELEKMAKEYREAVSEEDLIFSDIDNFLEMPVPNNWDSLTLWNKRNYYYRYTQDNEVADEAQSLTKTTAKEIARVCFKLESDSRRSKSTLTKINLYMSNLDSWNKQTIRYGSKTAKGFKRKL